MQDSPRLFIDSTEFPSFEPEIELALSPAQARYLGTVLRLAAGASVHVFNERDGEWECALTGVRKERGGLRLLRQTREARVTVGPVLVFAPLKRDATDMVIRMGTELGVSRFMPVTTARTNTHRINPERLRAIAIEAAEQCERLDIPEIDALMPLAHVVDAWPVDRVLYAAFERRIVKESGSIEANYGLLIGPEGGFSPEEMRWLSERDTIAPLSLGSLVLRADTAVCAGLARLALRRESSTRTE